MGSSANPLLFLPAAGLLGIAIGFVARPWIAPLKPVVETKTVEVEKEISPEALAKMCEELNPSDREKLTNAQSKITELTATLEAREAELEKFRSDAEARKKAGAAYAAKMRKLEEEVASLQSQLQTVTQERDQLLVELKDTVKKLEAQIQETEHYKAEAKKWKRKSTENAWIGFVADAKVQICDRGTRKRHDKCHEAVVATFSAEIQDHFETCVDTYQAMPTLGQLEKNATLPVFAQLLTDDKAFTSHDWFIQFCDPTLPEANRP